MRIAITWSNISGYLAACLRALARHPGVSAVRLLAVRPQPDGRTPYRADMLPPEVETVLVERADLDRRETAIEAFRDFRPDVMTISGWAIPAFHALAMSPDYRRAVAVLTMDTRRKPGSWRQFVGPLLKRRLFRRIDAWWGPGTRFRQLMAYWRIDPARVFEGSLAVDEHALEPLAEQRATGPWPRQFLYVGHFVRSKGVDVLANAWRRYRDSVGAAAAWPLVCCGKGPEAALLEQAGAANAGFVQPADLPAQLLRAGALILPSLSDAWGQVITEAGISGLPVIATDECGASVDAIREGESGFVVPVGDAAVLADRMRRLHDRTDDELRAMGVASHALCSRYTSAQWAETLVTIGRTMQR